MKEVSFQEIECREELIAQFTKHGINGNEDMDSTILHIFMEHASTIYEDLDQLKFLSFFMKDRYFFDFKLDLNRWLQMDTGQDASYYGNWVNPQLRTHITYCEGDIYVIVSKSDASFMKYMKVTRGWHLNNDGKVSLDPGLTPSEFVQMFMKAWEDHIEN